jgi:hypothetical protein
LRVPVTGVTIHTFADTLCNVAAYAFAATLDEIFC